MSLAERLFRRLAMLCCGHHLLWTPGLIDIGTALTNPFGGDREDFAVYHFTHNTAVGTRMICSGQPEGEAASAV